MPSASIVSTASIGLVVRTKKRMKAASRPAFRKQSRVVSEPRCSTDFIHDSLTDGRTFRVLTASVHANWQALRSAEQRWRQVSFWWWPSEVRRSRSLLETVG